MNYYPETRINYNQEPYRSSKNIPIQNIQGTNKKQSRDLIMNSPATRYLNPNDQDLERIVSKYSRVKIQEPQRPTIQIQNQVYSQNSTYQHIDHNYKDVTQYKTNNIGTTVEIGGKNYLNSSSVYDQTQLLAKQMKNDKHLILGISIIIGLIMLYFYLLIIF